jgi:hypothetical protein
MFRTMDMLCVVDAGAESGPAPARIKIALNSSDSQPVSNQLGGVA